MLHVLADTAQDAAATPSAAAAKGPGEAKGGRGLSRHRAVAEPHGCTMAAAHKGCRVRVGQRPPPLSHSPLATPPPPPPAPRAP